MKPNLRIATVLLWLSFSSMVLGQFPCSKYLNGSWEQMNDSTQTLFIMGDKWLMVSNSMEHMDSTIYNAKIDCGAGDPRNNLILRDLVTLKGSKDTIRFSLDAILNRDTLILSYVNSPKGLWYTRRNEPLDELLGKWYFVISSDERRSVDEDNLWVFPGHWSFGNFGSNSGVLYGSYNPCNVKCCFVHPTNDQKYLNYAQVKWGDEVVDYRIDLLTSDSLIITNMKDERQLVYSRSPFLKK